MEHYFKLNEPVIFNRNNKAMINNAFNRFTDQVKGKIDAWLQRSSGWVIEEILNAFINPLMPVLPVTARNDAVFSFTALSSI